MLETTPIHDLLKRARRRFAVQAVLEYGALALIPWLAFGSLVLHLVFIGLLAEFHAGIALSVLTAALLSFVVWGVSRIPSKSAIIAKIDREHALQSRLSNAWAFDREDSDAKHSSETKALMSLAIKDGVRAAPLVRLAAVAPLRWPDKSRRLVLTLLCVLILLALSRQNQMAPVATLVPDISKVGPLGDKVDPFELDLENREFAAERGAELRELALSTQDSELLAMADQLSALLGQVETKSVKEEDFWEALSRVERGYLGGDAETEKRGSRSLVKAAASLKRSRVGRALRKAIQRGDLASAERKLEQASQALANGELTTKEISNLAKDFEQAASALAAFESKDRAELDTKISTIQKKLAEGRERVAAAAQGAQRDLAEGALAKDQNALRALQEKAASHDKSRTRRELKRLTRHMKDAAAEMQESAQGDATREDAANSMRDVARSAGRISQDARRMNNQKRVASQLSDLKEALRRAKRKSSRGPRKSLGREKSEMDFDRRARGGQGSGSGSGAKGHRSSGTYGEGHDPDIIGPQTPAQGNLEDQSIQGVSGRGPSIRETVLGAASQGFASREYAKVFADYKSVVEEVIDAEKVPSGYKYYVKRYFQKIKPEPFQPREPDAPSRAKEP